MAFRIWGEGPSVLALHGFTDCALSFAPLAAWLDGVRLIAPDLPGHGDSDSPQRHDLDTLADDLATFADTLGEPSMPVIGHSMGSFAALALARRVPRLASRLVLISTALDPKLPEPVRQAISRLVDPVDLTVPGLAGWHANRQPVAPDFIAALERAARNMAAADWRGWLAAIEAFDPRAALMSCHTPLLSLGGVSDPIFPPERRSGLAQLCPSAQTFELAGHGHNPHWERPDRVAEAIRRFIAA